MKPNIGVIGMRTMGSNLARNIESRGREVVVYNRDGRVTDDFVSRFRGRFIPAKTLQEFVSSLEAPRQVFLMIQAGPAIDSVMEGLLPLLERGDVLMDGGNSHFEDTQRREARAAERGIYFLGVGISGGEAGALKGPSLMPGGPKAGWQTAAPLLGSIAAQVNGEPCTCYIGPGGAGHFVKMVHNGIEYGDMQLIAEAYHLLKCGLKWESDRLSEVFDRWNEGPLNSYLIEITSIVLRRRDREEGGFLVDKVLDKAGQKGTGKWTAIEAFKLAVPIPTLSAAVEARVLSAKKEERMSASGIFSSPPGLQTGEEGRFCNEVGRALYAAKIMAYAQGMSLLAAASREYRWDLNLSGIAALWRGGCIIRARFLESIRAAYEKNKALSCLLLDDAIRSDLEESISGLRAVTALAAGAGVPVPAFSASLSYFDSYRSARLPHNLTQAQRDHFGAHTYERADKPGVFHSQWEN